MRHEIDVRDEAGRLIGRFIPESARLTYQQMLATCPFTEEELEAFDREPGGRSLAEIWQRLGRGQ